MADVFIRVNVTDKSASTYLDRIQAKIDKINNTPIAPKFKMPGLGGAGKGAGGAGNLPNTEGLAGLEKAYANVEKRTNSLNTATTSLMSNIAKFTQWYIIGNAVSGVVRSFDKAIDTMKAVDDELVIVRKVTGATTEELEQIEKQAYKTASAYGVAADKYLSSVSAFARAGYHEQAEALAELSTKTQIVGDVNEETANQFLLAVDAAYQYNGEISKLERVLDGANEIDNKYATSIGKIAEGLGKVAPLAAQAHIGVDELTAAIGTITSATQRSGTEAATAFRALVLNILGDTKTTFEDEAGEVTSWSMGEIAGLRDVLKTYAPEAIKAAEATGQVINPMKAIAGLAEAMDKGILTEQKLMEMVSDIGGKLRTTQLLALIQNFDDYEAMLADFAGSVGSADREVENAMDSWTRKTKVLNNTWAEFISNSVDTDWIKFLLDGAIAVLDFADNLGLATVAVGGFVVAFNAGSVAQGGAAFVSNIANSTKALGSYVKQLFSAEAAEKARTTATLLAMEADNAQKVATALNTAAQEARRKALDALNNEKVEAVVKEKLLDEAVDAETRAEAANKIAIEKKAAAQKAATAVANKYLAVIGLVVAALAIGKMAYDKHIENLRASAEASSQAAEKHMENYNALNELASKASETDANIETLTTAFYAQAQQCGKTKTEIDALITKYNGLAGAAREAARAQLESAYAEAIIARDDSAKAFTSYWDWTKYPGASQYEEEFGKTGYSDLDGEIQGILEKYGFDVKDGFSEGQKTFKFNYGEKNKNGIAVVTPESMSKVYEAYSEIGQAIALYATQNGKEGELLNRQNWFTEAFGKSAYDSVRDITEAWTDDYTLYNENADKAALYKSILDGTYVLSEESGEGDGDGGGNGGGGGGGTSTDTNSNKDTVLERHKGLVSYLESELELAEKQNKPLDEKLTIVESILKALHNQAEYMRSAGYSQEEINRLSLDYLGYEEKANDMIQEEIDGYKERNAEATKAKEEAYELAELEGKSLSEKITLLKEIEESLAYEEQYLRSINADESEINEKVKRQYEIRQQISDLEKEALDTAKELSISYYDAAIEALEKERDLEQEQLDIEEKKLAVLEAQAALINAQNERTIRYFNAATGRWEWGANQQDVKSAQDALTSAKKSLSNAEDEAEYKANLSALKSARDEHEKSWGNASNGTIGAEELISVMKRNSQLWSQSSSESEKQSLADANSVLGSKMGWSRGEDGVWRDKTGTRVYDSGGILNGIGGIKATYRDEAVLPPDLTAKLLRPVSNNLFSQRMAELSYIYGGEKPTSGNVFSSSNKTIGKQHNGNVYQFGNISIGEERAKSMSVYELAQMSRNLCIYKNQD